MWSEFHCLNACFTGCRVAVDAVWTYPEQFGDVILRLGGIHMLMSFGALMADSGLSEISESTFGGVSIMLSGEKPHKICIPFVYW